MKSDQLPLVLFVGDDSELFASLRKVVETSGFALQKYQPGQSPGGLRDAGASVAVICCEDDAQNARQFLDQDNCDDDVEVLLIGYGEQQRKLQDWLTQGRAFFLGRPLDMDYLSQLLLDIRAELDRNTEASAAVDLSNEPLDQFGLLRGSSKSMRRIYRLLRKVAPTDTSVLICGESGTGKELVAETIHAASLRSEAPFLAVNCAAIASELVESELFGHEKGSFSGAVKQHSGLFERASGGTLFLDEITEMSPEVQVKLLRVLESRKFRRVGGESDISCNVRILAATNRSPEEAIADGKLRQDLYFRVASFVIRLPPLRERGGDIAGLADFFLAQLNRVSGTDRGMSAEVEVALREAPWRGNVRELKSAVERAYLLAQENIELHHMPNLAPAELVVEEGDYLRVSVGSSLEDTERRLIFATLELVDGNKPKAAEALGISLKTLYNRLSRYNEGEQVSDGNSGF